MAKFVFSVLGYRFSDDLLQHMMDKQVVSTQYSVSVGFPLHIEKSKLEKGRLDLEAGEECIGDEECSATQLKKRRTDKIYTGTFHTHAHKLSSMSVDDIIEACQVKITCVGGLGLDRVPTVWCYKPRASCDDYFYKRVEQLRIKEDDINRRAKNLNRRIEREGIDSVKVLDTVDQFIVDKEEFEVEKANVIRKIFDTEQLL